MDVLRAISSLGCSRYDIAVLGSESSKDLDLVIIDRIAEANGSYHACVAFLPFLHQISTRTGARIILKHEHRSFIAAGRPLLHLLYYPSYEHLYHWETMSFAANLFETGRFLAGERDSLKGAYADYRYRRMPSSGVMMRSHLLTYSDQAITNMIYSALESNIYSKNVYLENLLYVIRFSLIEILVSRIRAEDDIPFWNWDGILSFIAEDYSDVSILERLLRYYQTRQCQLTYEQLSLLFAETLKLSDYEQTGIVGMLSGFDKRLRGKQCGKKS